MNQREAKRWACSWLASRARHGAEDWDEEMSDEDNERVVRALDELAEEMERRAGERIEQSGDELAQSLGLEDP
jgi:hypothetical protein